MNKSFIVFVEDNGSEYKATVNVTFEPKSFLSDDRTAKGARIEYVCDAETNSRISALSENLKKKIEAEAFRVAEQYGPD